MQRAVIKGETAGMVKVSLKVQGHHGAGAELMWGKTLSGGSRRALRAGRRDWKQKGEQSPCISMDNKTFTLGSEGRPVISFLKEPDGGSYHLSENGAY